MTKLEVAIERLRALPSAAQEALAEEILDLLDEAPALTQAQWAEIERRIAGPDDFASDEEVEAFFKRHGA
ncbi:MAG: hypothetical protein JNJ73_14095 [Hyphomonadaceae bacterium]|nr:hypothetical protein [Hyphomonadaceae bacterium]